VFCVPLFQIFLRGNFPIPVPYSRQKRAQPISCEFSRLDLRTRFVCIGRSDWINVGPASRGTPRGNDNIAFFAVWAILGPGLAIELAAKQVKGGLARICVAAPPSGVRSG
jgi:hypothetical protein